MGVGTGMKRKTIIFFVFAISLLIAALPLAGCGGEAAPEFEDKASEGVYPKIQEIIYPTLGYPQIVPAGEEFTLEFDLKVDDPGAAQPGSVDNWGVSITSSNSYIPYKADLEVTGAELGTSLRWPEESGREVYEVYLVTARAPGDVPCDLYDLEVRVDADGNEVADSQPNSLAVIDGFKEDYKVIQVTDIHVHDIEPPDACMHDRELHDAVYLKKAIEQINLIHPDFVVFSGDLINGQIYLPQNWPPEDERTGISEYEYENLWAYEEMTALDVPCFYVIGNHDGYYDTQKDGYEWWTEMFGPLHYSFDYGDHHYTMINTMDWSQENRLLEKGPSYGFAKILEPVKWMGQARSGGDLFVADQAPPPEDYGDQLGWIRDDLAANQDAGLRMAFCHHDPAQIISWEDADFSGYKFGGNGEGRLALQKLCADYGVSMILSGHEHHDLITEMTWTDGLGSTIYANTTCIEPKCGITDEYPGYRILEVSEDQVLSYNYQDPKWSYPYYDGINIGEENDLDVLYDPAIEIDFSNGGDWSKAEEDVACTITNKLDKDFEGAFLKFYMPAPGEGSGYQVSGVTDSSTVTPPDQQDWVVVYAYFDIPALSGKEVRVSR